MGKQLARRLTKQHFYHNLVLRMLFFIFLLYAIKLIDTPAFKIIKKKE
jgi:hypothetical protein